MIANSETPRPLPAASTESGFRVFQAERLKVLDAVCASLMQSADILDAAAVRAKSVLEKELSHNLAEEAHSIRGGLLSLRNYLSRIRRPRTGWTAGNPKPAILSEEGVL